MRYPLLLQLSKHGKQEATKPRARPPGDFSPLRWSHHSLFLYPPPPGAGSTTLLQEQKASCLQWSKLHILQGKIMLEVEVKFN